MTAARAGPLVDVHAHFLHEACGRADWAERNQSRFAAGSRIGITLHIASILGSWGRMSPTYFPSPEDVSAGNEALRAIIRSHPALVKGYVAVNPNYAQHAIAEIELGLAAGMIGIKLAASRRAGDALLDAIATLAAERGVPVLQHAWQRRTREVSNQEISDALDLMDLAARHPAGHFILAHIGGGGDWAHSLRALAGVPNVWVDLSGSGVDRGMLELCLEQVGPEHLVWGTDLTMDTGWAKLRALEAMGLAREALEGIRWKTAARLFRLSL